MDLTLVTTIRRPPPRGTPEAALALSAFQQICPMMSRAAAASPA
jgi:hypothetical protein